VAEVPDVAVAAVDVFLALLDRHLVLLRVSDGILARLNVPLPPGRDDLDMRCDGFIRQFEAHLIVALAGAAVGQAVGRKLEGDFRLALGNDRACHGGAKQVSVLVNRARAKGRPNVIAHKFFAKILHVRRRRAGREGFLARGLEVFLLAHVANHGDDFAAVILPEPGNNDGGVQPSGISEHDLFGFVLLGFHNSSLAIRYSQAGAQQARPLQRKTKKVR